MGFLEAHETAGQRHQQNGRRRAIQSAPARVDPGLARAAAPAAPCPACGDERTAFWRIARASDARLAARPAYALRRCDSCGTAFLSGRRPEDATVLYRHGTYGVTAKAARAAVSPLRSLYDRERMRFLRHVRAGARVFEVGAGDGRFLRSLARAGYKASGLDPYARTAMSGVAPKALEDTELAAASTDAVVLWHVLEHLDDPEEALRRIAAWLTPGGQIVVAVPNAAGLQARIGGDRWFHQDVPRHRTQFTPDGMLRLLERAGFRIEQVRHVLVEQSLLGMWLTLLNRITREPDVLFRLVKRNLPHRSRAAAARDVALTAAAGVPLLAVAAALELVAALAGRGGTFVVRASLAPKVAA